jgi:hypothetical protein
MLFGLRRREKCTDHPTGGNNRKTVKMNFPRQAVTSDTRSWRRTPACILVALCVAGSGAQVVPTPNGYLLEASYRKGEVLRYGAVTTIGGMADNNRAIPVSYLVSITVKSVKGGIATVKLDESPPKNGKTTLPIPTKSASFQLDRHNKVIGASNGSQAIVAFPDHPVAIGANWSSTTVIPLGGGTGGSVVNVTSQLKGFRTEKGRRIATIGQTLRGFASGEGTALVDAADGSLLASDLELRIHVRIQNEDATYPLEMIIKRQMP